MAMARYRPAKTLRELLPEIRVAALASLKWHLGRS
jgi:hypothetical protein